MDYLNLFHIYKQHALFGRYIPLALVERVAQGLQLKMEVSGASVNQRPLYQLEIGTGARKVLLWSQMHGNESTTTKALFDFIAFLGSDEPEAKRLCRHFHFCILPMVNPDGAEVYTRVNANGVDLNRDAVALTQPESRFLREVFEAFQPDLAYNLHDQRTIFG
ncbi:M14 family zinc carboxypeptidase, partial [Flavobacterium sp.]